MIYRTRIAPSPTGMMHIGTARTALFSWLAARATSGQFILRIDDTDTDRNNEDTVQPILDGLTWLGLNWDEFYRQSDRTEKYLTYATFLENARFAKRADNGALILDWHDFMPRQWTDECCGIIPITDTNIKQIDGKTVLLRGGDKLNQPTYQFASVVDDFDMNVNFIIRGQDHVTNTAKQLAIWSAINQSTLMPFRRDFPKFAHIGLIFQNKKKMSKRDGAASLLDYRDNGYHPDAMFNALLRLGWAPREDNKINSILTRDRALEMFLTQGRMNQSNANFDKAKLDHLNKVFNR